MAPHNIAEGYGAVVAALGRPASVASEHDLQNGARLNHHHDRRDQRGEDDFDDG
jgi:hypothetical protein